MVKAGYKQTEVGVIPEDWEVTLIGTVASIRTGPFGSALHEKDYVLDGTPIITVEHLSEYGVVHNNLPLVSNKDKKRLNSYLLEKNDIVFSRVGSIDRNSIIKETENGWLFSGRILRVRPNKLKVQSNYLSYHLHLEATKDRIRSVAVGQTMPSLNTEILKNILVVVPKALEEQITIATALSDVDALITSLTDLIDKKRQIKTATMQQLLTGKQRLAGFSEGKCMKQTELGEIPEDWEITQLGKLGYFSKGRGIKKDDAQSGEFPCIRYGEIYTYHNDIIRDFNSHISEKVAKTSYKLKTNSLLFAGSGETKEEIGKCVAFIGDQEVYAGGDIVIQQITKGVVSFLGYLLNTPLVVKQKANRGQGDAVVHISSQALSNVLIAFPPEPEQQAIAQVLSDMDDNINALETRLAKTKAIKQGMMQELLTGKTRLV